MPASDSASGPTCAMSRAFNPFDLALNLCTRVLADATPPERLPETGSEHPVSASCSPTFGLDQDEARTGRTRWKPRERGAGIPSVEPGLHILEPAIVTRGGRHPDPDGSSPLSAHLELDRSSPLDLFLGLLLHPEFAQPNSCQETPHATLHQDTERREAGSLRYIVARTVSCAWC